jgi:hypothetical protein
MKGFPKVADSHKNGVPKAAEVDTNFFKYQLQWLSRLLHVVFT